MINGQSWRKNLSLFDLELATAKGIPACDHGLFPFETKNANAAGIESEQSAGCGTET